MIGRTNAGASAGLNFRVIQREEKPSAARKNDIWVCTDVKIPEYAFSAEDPYLAYKDVDLLDGTTIKDGYFSTTGSITAQQTAYGELYSENYISVKYGTTYYWTYTLSEKKAMWLAIVEYTGDKVFSSRIIKVSGVDGNSESGTYTPSKSTVTSVRISWRAYNDAGCKVTMTEKNVAYYPEPIPEGAVWFATGTSSTVAYNALRRNDIRVYPLSAKQHIGDKWCSKSAELYDGTDWIQFSSEIVYLYNHGDECTDVTGGWTGYAYKSSTAGSNATKPTVTKGDETITFALSSTSDNYRMGSLWIEESIDLTKYGKLYLDVKSFTPSNNVAYIGVTDKKQNGFTKIANVSFNSAGLVALDISSLTGEYYVYFSVGGQASKTTFSFDEAYLA